MRCHIGLFPGPWGGGADVWVYKARSSFFCEKCLAIRAKHTLSTSSHYELKISFAAHYRLRPYIGDAVLRSSSVGQ